MKCPNCGAAELAHGTRDMPYIYKGESTTIPAVTGDFCPACGEGVLELGESIRTSELMLEFNKQVNASFVNPDFIVNVRKKLQLDQREAAVIFGGGINAFSRYENGKTRPPLALVQLFRVLDLHPDLLNEIKQTQKSRPRVTYSTSPTKEYFMAKGSGGNKTHTEYRSSKTGKSVRESYGKNNPNTTQKERVPNPGYGDTKKK